MNQPTQEYVEYFGYSWKQATLEYVKCTLELLQMIIYIDDYGRCEKGFIQLVVSSYTLFSLNSKATKKLLNNNLKQ